MNLNNIVIVLSRPQDAKNVGSVCRAMANCDIATLRLAGTEKNNFCNEEVLRVAVHSQDIWENCTPFPSITDATKDCTLVIGTTRRHGSKRGRAIIPTEVAKLIAKVTDKGGKVALVFGNEETGLTESELNECTQIATIPSSKKQGSLNLSHAVMVICYACFTENCSYSTSYTPITSERLDKVVENFLTPKSSEGTRKLWRDVLSRAILSEGEAQKLEMWCKGKVGHGREGD